MDFENLLVEKTDRMAWVKLNRPDKLNALNRQLIIELITALQTLDNDESVDVIIIKGEGRGFCVGMDLKEYRLGGGVVDDIVATYGPWQTIKRLINVSADLGFTAGLKIEEIIGRRGRANIDPDEDRDKRLNRFRKQEF